MTTQADKCAAAVSRAQRKMVLRVRLEELMRRVPDSWVTWDSEQVRTFNGNCRKLRSMGEGTPMRDMLIVGEQIARAYGVGMATLDPNHGEAP